MVVSGTAFAVVFRGVPLPFLFCYHMVTEHECRPSYWHKALEEHRLAAVKGIDRNGPDITAGARINDGFHDIFTTWHHRFSWFHNSQLLSLNYIHDTIESKVNLSLIEGVWQNRHLTFAVWFDFLSMCFLLSFHQGPECKKSNRRWLFSQRRSLMSLHTLLVLAALVAGVLILVMPKMLHYIVAAWLILYGIIGFIR
jgi:hypothetical protein